MSLGLDPAAAPPFIGPTPPDRVTMTFGEHLSAALNHLASTTLSDQDMRDMKTFMVAVDQVVKQKLQQQGGQLLPEEMSAAPAGLETGGPEDYGTQAGTEPANMGL